MVLDMIRYSPFPSVQFEKTAIGPSGEGPAETSHVQLYWCCRVFLLGIWPLVQLVHSGSKTGNWTRNCELFSRVPSSVHPTSISSDYIHLLGNA